MLQASSMLFLSFHGRQAGSKYIQTRLAGALHIRGRPYERLHVVYNVLSLEEDGKTPP